MMMLRKTLIIIRSVVFKRSIYEYKDLEIIEHKGEDSNAKKKNLHLR